LQVRAIASPDTDFAPKGNVTRINYLESFREYKRMLSPNPPDPMYERIFSIFNASLFGATTTPQTEFILDTGDYNAELMEFNEQLAAERIGDAAAADLPLPSLPPAPSSSPEPHVSVSVTSNVSHVTTAVNVVTSNVALIPADEEVGVPLPVTKTKAVKKKTAKLPTTTTDPPTNDTEPAAGVRPAAKRNSGRKVKATSGEPSNIRSTRSRG